MGVGATGRFGRGDGIVTVTLTAGVGAAEGAGRALAASGVAAALTVGVVNTGAAEGSLIGCSAGVLAVVDEAEMATMAPNIAAPTKPTKYSGIDFLLAEVRVTDVNVSSRAPGSGASSKLRVRADKREPPFSNNGAMSAASSATLR